MQVSDDGEATAMPGRFEDESETTNGVVPPEVRFERGRYTAPTDREPIVVSGGDVRRFLHLTNRHRAPSANLALGVLLAFNAGAVNAGGFLLLDRYTSHMTGFASQMADGLALKHPSMTTTAAGAILSFMGGAALTAALVNFARRQGIRAVYALPLVLEALLLMSFGLVGALALSSGSAHYLSPTVFLLSFIMGLQNAVGSKSSGGSIRTTHMTGNVTDLGMELGKLLYWNRSHGLSSRPVASDKTRLQRSGGLLLAFVGGGVAGAIGFQSAGFIFVVPLAVVLLVLAAMPLAGVSARRLKRSATSAG